MAKQYDLDKYKFTVRWRQEHFELGYPQKLNDQADSHGMPIAAFGRLKLIHSLEDDRLDHLTALTEQLHAKIRHLEQTVDELRTNQMKGIMAILIHVCDFSPDQAQRLLRGEAPV